MPLTGALALNLTGHLVGAALYAMLVVLVVAPPRGAARPTQGPWWRHSTRLALCTGVLGLAWNLGALATDLYTLSGVTPPALALAGAFAALGFLPAVVIYAVVRGEERGGDRLGTTVAGGAIALASLAGVRHVMAARAGMPVPDATGLLWLTVGASALLAILLVWTRRRRGRPALWVPALAIFAVSGFHLTGHSGREAWWMALIGHHASLPLVVAILQQEYRFAFADVFLKRASALLALAGLMLGVWLLADAWLPLEQVHLDDPVTFAVLLALWLAAAVVYPPLRRLAGRAIDRWLLARPDPARQHAAFLSRLAASTSEPDVLAVSREAIALAVNAGRVATHERADDVATGEPAVRVPVAGLEPLVRADDAVVVTLVTMRPPHPVLVVGDLQLGRRILSDDLDVLDALASAAARRLDAIRDERRRLEQAVREQEVGRLAIEAELRAVRAQLHPHFLFNALNTVRYLIDAAPERAGTVLLQLTGVLRGVLRRSSDEFSTLGEEVDLVRSYLAIEHARFEARLHLEIDVPESLHGIAVPALVLQPLVENAVVHGISPIRRGGAIGISADLDAPSGVLRLIVRDSGAGASPHAFQRPERVGLASVERRLALHYGDTATLHVHSAPGEGTTVCLSLPVAGPLRSRRGASVPDPTASEPVEARW